MSDVPWGDKCCICGEQASGTDYGLVGPLNSVKEQLRICLKCIGFLKKYHCISV